MNIINSIIPGFLKCSNEEDSEDDIEWPKQYNKDKSKIKNLSKNKLKDMIQKKCWIGNNKLYKNLYNKFNENYDFYGHIKDGWKIGKGIMIIKNKKKIIGNFDENIMNGNFISIKKNNTIYLELYKDNLLIKKEILLDKEINFNLENEILLFLEIPEFNDNTKKISKNSLFSFSWEDIDENISIEEFNESLNDNNFSIDILKWNLKEFINFLEFYNLNDMNDILKENNINYKEFIMYPEIYLKNIKFKKKGLEIQFKELVEKINHLKNLKNKRKNNSIDFSNYKNLKNDQELYDNLLFSTKSNSLKIKEDNHFFKIKEFIDDSLKLNNINIIDKNDFKFDKFLFKNSICDVYEGKSFEQKVIIVKLKNEDNNFNEFWNIINDLNNLKHPNILTYKGISNNKNNLFIIFEKDNRINLKELLYQEKLNDNKIWEISNKLFSTLTFLINKGIKNIDIKKEYIYLNNCLSFKWFNFESYFERNIQHLKFKNQEYFFLALIIIDMYLNWDLSNNKYKILKTFILNPYFIDEFLIKIKNKKIFDLIKKCLNLFHYKK